MALNIRNRETERLAAELAKWTGETKTEAVKRALAERLNRLQREQAGDTLVSELNAIAEECARLPIIDTRPADEILGYDDAGLPRP